MMQARAAGGHAMGAARNFRGAARHAAYAAGQAAAVAHVAAHELGAAAYAIKAACASAPEGGEAAGRLECQWQRDQFPKAIRELVLDDQRLRNDICWSAFNPKLRPIRQSISGLSWDFTAVAGRRSGYFKVSGIGTPMSSKACRWVLVGSASISMVTWVPVYRTWLRVSVARCPMRPRKLW